MTSQLEKLPVVALMRKDLQVHWRNLLAMLAGVAALMSLLLWLLPPREDEGAFPAILLAVLVNFHLGFPTWLIDRERSRETFALLRAMPLSDAAIVTSKFAMHAILSLLGFGVMLAIYPRALTAVSPAMLVTLLAGSLTFGCLVIALRLGLPERLGTVAPLAPVLLLLLIGARLSQQHDLVAAFARLSSRWWFHYALEGGALLTSGAIWLATVGWFQSRETRDLLSS